MSAAPKLAVVRDEFQEAAHANPQIYQIARRLAHRFYEGLTDKGSNIPSTIWNHIREVESAVHDTFFGHVSEEELLALQAIALLHEVPELKFKGEDGKRHLLYPAEHWKRQFRAAGLPEAIIEPVDALGVRQDEPYLEAIRRCARVRAAAQFKYYADLPVNSSGRGRPSLKKEDTSAQFRDKKSHLYPMALLYLEARLNGLEDMSVANFIMTNPGVPVALKDEAILRKYSAPGTPIPVPVLNLQSHAMAFIRRGVAGVRQTLAL